MFEPGYFYFFEYLFVYLVFLFSFFVIGYQILKLLKNQIEIRGRYSLVFVSIILGLITLITLYSIIITRAQTIHVFFVLLSLYIAFDWRKKGTPAIVLNAELEPLNFKTALKAFFEISGVGFCLFCWQALFIFKPGEMPFQMPWNDDTYYTDVAISLFTSGQENYYEVNNLLSSAFHGAIPYHYFELWLGAMTSFNGFLYPFLSFKLISFTLLATLVYAGFNALFEKEKTFSYRYKIFALGSLFMGTSFCYFNDQYDTFTSLFCGNSPMLIRYQKYIPYMVFTLFSLLFFQNKQHVLGILSLLIFCIISSTVFLFIAGGILLFLLVPWFYKPFITIKEARRLFIYTFLFCIGMGAFYGSQNTLTNLSPYPFYQYSEFTSFDFQTIKIAIIEVSYRILNHSWGAFKHSLVYLLVGGVVFYKTRTWKSSFTYILLLCLLLGNIFHAVFYKYPDSWQFLLNLLPIAYTALYYFIIRSGFQAQSRWLKQTIFIAIGGILLYNVYDQYTVNKALIAHENVYEDPFLRKVYQEFKSEKNVVGVYLGQASDYYFAPGNTIYVKSKSGFLKYSKSMYSMIDIGIFSIQNTENERGSLVHKTFLNDHVFYQYVKGKGAENHIEEAKASFIRDKKIGFAVALKDYAYSEPLKQLIEKIIIDSKTGTQFVVFKRPIN